jgi:hypothetical protein
MRAEPDDLAMIRRDHRIDIAERTRQREAALTEAGAGLADAVHSLIPGCTAAVVVVETGPNWRMLAQRGPVEMEGCWRQLVALHARGHDREGRQSGGEALVVPFRAERIRAMLVAVPAAGGSLPRGMHEIVRPLLDAGGLLLDAAVGAAGGTLRLVPPMDAPRGAASSAPAGAPQSAATG